MGVRNHAQADTQRNQGRPEIPRTQSLVSLKTGWLVGPQLYATCPNQALNMFSQTVSSRHWGCFYFFSRLEVKEEAGHLGNLPSFCLPRSLV